MKVESKMVQIDYIPAASPPAKQRRKTIKKNTDRSASEFINKSPLSPFDDVTTRPLSAEDSSVYAFNAGNDVNSNPRLSSNSSNRHFFNVLDSRSRSNTFNGQPNFNGICDLDLPAPESILLHEVAYCVTVPEKPRLFLLTSRGREGLTCRVFLFSSREKAHLLKLCLARQFELAYTEWQSRLLRRASRRKSSLLDRQTSQSSLSNGSGQLLSNSDSENLLDTVAEPLHSCQVDCESDNGMDHGSSSEEEDPFVDHEMHLEFKRRASCLANPERLVVGDNKVNDLSQRFKSTLKRSDAFTESSPSSDEGNSS